MTTEMAKQRGRKARGRKAPEWVLGAVGFVSFFDRFATPPMLLVLADRTGLTLGQAVQIVSAYYFLYAVGQPLWGLISDRFGRSAVLRAALVGALAGGVASTLFGSFVPLLLVRAFTGLMVGALYPTLLTLLGDTRTGIQRARSLSNLQIYSALGNAFATLAAGTLAALVDWRLVFGLTPLGCVALLAALRGVSDGTVRQRPRLRLAFAAPALGVYALALVEGVALMGLLAYIVPALQNAGVGVSLAGVLAATYGLGIIGGARLMRHLVRRFSRTQLIAAGGCVLVAAFAASSLSQSPAALTATALLIGVTNAVLHVSMQGWATEVAPQARATSVSLFVCSLFLGSSLGTWATAALAQEGRYGLIFAFGLAVSIVLTVAATLGHARWTRRGPQGEAGAAQSSR